MAQTYVAERSGPGGFSQRVCLKRIRPDMERDPDFVRQFMAEARIAASLRHAAIAQVLDFGESGGDYYLALELIDGGDLRGLLATWTCLPPSLCILIATELSAALMVAHGGTQGESVVHRDISPSNVLVSREGEVKLTDFGIARAVSEPSVTRTGIVKGKVPYMAPEYAATGKLDARSDLFGLGVMLYQCLAGDRPYDGATDLDTLHRAAQGNHRPLSAAAPQAPEGLCRLVEQLIDPDPANRPQTAREVNDALCALPADPAARRKLGEAVRTARGEEDSEHASPATADSGAAEPWIAAGADLGGALPGTQPISSGRVTRTAQPVNRSQPQPRPGWAIGLAATLALGSLGLYAALATDEPAKQLTVPRPAAPSPQPQPRGDPKPDKPGSGPRRPPEQPRATPPAPPAAPPLKPSPQPLRDKRRGLIEVVVLPFGQVSVDGEPVGDAPAKLTLPPGLHRITAHSQGDTKSRKVELAPGERKRVVFR